LDFFELLAKKDSLYEGGFSLFALLSLPEAAIDGDDTFESCHLQLNVDVARLDMETVESWAAKDHVVRTLKGYHLKGYGLFEEILLIAEGNLDCDGSQRFCLAARNH
jgi:hypothetical protein